jgi:hypothetical protein
VPDERGKASASTFGRQLRKKMEREWGRLHAGPLCQWYRGERGRPRPAAILLGLAQEDKSAGRRERACAAGPTARWGGDRAGQIEREEGSEPSAKGKQAEHWAARPKTEGGGSFPFPFLFPKSILNFDFEFFLLSFETCNQHKINVAACMHSLAPMPYSCF